MEVVSFINRICLSDNGQLQYNVTGERPLELPAVIYLKFLSWIRILIN